MQQMIFIADLIACSTCFFHLQLDLISGFLLSWMCSLVLAILLEGAFLLRCLSL